MKYSAVGGAEHLRQMQVQYDEAVMNGRLKKAVEILRFLKKSDCTPSSGRFAQATRAVGAKNGKASQTALLMLLDAISDAGLPPNNCYAGRSAVGHAAYFGLDRLLQRLLDIGCSAVFPCGENDCFSHRHQIEHSLFSAISNAQQTSISVLVHERSHEISAQLQREAQAAWPLTRPTTLSKAHQRHDVATVQLLKEHGAALLITRNLRSWEKIVDDVYGGQKPIKCWTRELHWTFPGTDRRILNWMWHAIAKEDMLIPSEVWLRVFSYTGRGWWQDAQPESQCEWLLWEMKFCRSIKRNGI